MGHARQDAGSPAELYSDDILHAMVQAAPVAIVVADDGGSIVLVNNKLTDMFGYGSDELIGESIETLMPERYRGGHVGYREEYAGNPRQRPMGSGLDLAGRRRDGSEFPIEVGLSHYRSGERSWVMATVADITRRKQNEEFLERRVQERTREIDRRRQVSDTLRDILAILNSDRPLAEILQHIVVQASLLLQADASAIYQVQDAEPAVIIQASCGLSREQLGNPFSLTLPAAVKQVARNGEPVTIAAGPDASDVASSAFSDEASGDGSNTYCAQLAVPLRMKDETYGGLMLYYIEPRKFSDEEIELAVMFGDQAVLAIENAGLRARAERTAIAAERNRIAATYTIP